MDSFADVVTFAKGKAATDGSTGAGSPHGIKGIDIEGQVDGGVGTNVGEGHFDNATNAVASTSQYFLFVTGRNEGVRKLGLPVNIEHAKGLDVVVSENLLLVLVDITKTNVDKLLDVQQHVIGDPAKVLLLVTLGQTRSKSNRHAVDVTAVTALGGVDVRVSIDPNKSNLAVQTLASSLGAASDSANGNAVITTKSQNETSLLGVLVNLVRDLAVDGRGGERVLHATVVRVRRGHQLLVLLDLGIAVQLVAELIADLVEQSGRDERLGAGIDTSFGLWKGMMRQLQRRIKD